MKTSRSVTSIVAAVATSVVLLMGMSACSASASRSGDSIANDEQAAPAAVEPGSDAGKDGAAQDAAAGAPAVASDGSAATQSFVTTGSASLIVKDPIAALDDVVALVEKAGGRADAREQHEASGGQAATASAQLRIPSSHMTDVLTKIRGVGDLVSLHQASTNVTLTVRDLTARISALQASADRMQQLLATATSTTDLIAIESALSSRQADLESLKSQKATLDEQVALSTLDITITTPADAVIPEEEGPSNFFAGFADGWDALIGFLGVVLIGIGVVLPWLAIIGIPAAAIVIMTRRRRRIRRPDGAIAVSTQPTEPGQQPRSPQPVPPAPTPAPTVPSSAASAPPVPPQPQA